MSSHSRLMSERDGFCAHVVQMVAKQSMGMWSSWVRIG